MARADTTLAIRRWRRTYRVPRDHPAPEALRHRLDDALGARVTTALAHVLARALPQASTRSLSVDDDAVVFVRELDFELGLDASLDADALAAACAAALTCELLRVLGRHDVDGNVVAFASPVAHLASYVAHRAAGSGKARWFDEAFAGLALLDDSAAIRTALTQDAEAGMAALRALSAGSLQRVVTVLAPPDALHLVATWLMSRALSDVESALTTARAALVDSGHAAATRSSEALALSVLAGASAPHHVAAAQLTLVLARAVGVSDPTRSNAPIAIQLETALRDDARLHAIARAIEEPRVLAALLREESQDSRGSIAAPCVTSYTAWGGAFLLMDRLLALPIEAAIGDAPPLDDTPAVAMVRWLVLGHAIAGPRWRAFADDAWWRTAFGIGPRVSIGAVVTWLESVALPADLTTAPAAITSTPDKLTTTRGKLATPPASATSSSATFRGACATPHPPRRPLRDFMDPATPLPPRESRRIARAARCVIERFAAGLPGYAESSRAHLQRNFLDVAARIEPEPSRIVVTLTRPPLDLVLGLVGANRGERRWAALDARPFVLHAD